MNTTATQMDLAAVRTAFRDQVRSVVAVDNSTFESILIGMLAGGHVLIEGIPGTGKTLLARTLANCIGGSFNRIQFTNDLMPSDIVGTTIWKPDEQRFHFIRGPMFANVVLCDEINRTSPRTMSCLLEAMENGSVSIEGQTTSLGNPFIVLATRNGIEFHGTFPMPEAALDRFLVRVELGYPDRESELQLYRGRDPEATLADLEPVVDLDTFRAMIASVRSVAVSEPVAEYCYRLVQATREHRAITIGASPRAALNWLMACRARASLDGRDYVLPDDLKTLMLAVLEHRVFLADGGPSGPVLHEILSEVAVEL